MSKPNPIKTLILFLVICGTLYAQSGGRVHPIEQVHATVSQFQVVKGMDHPGYTGDLNVNIPLLKIPGRNGLDYNIELQYVCGNGVPVQESASWVGLGWNLNQYQITCNPNYAIAANPTPQGSPIAYTNKISNEGADLYYLSFPGGSTQIRLFSDGKWYPLEWSGIKIESEAVTNVPTQYSQFQCAPNINKDYSRFIVTDMDGTRYIFAKALTKSTNKVLINHCAKNCANDYNHSYHAYHYVFKLTAILSPDYVDGGGNPFAPNDGGADKGNWIRLDYSASRFHRTDISDPYPNMEIDFLERITTPTHYAQFNLSLTDDQTTIYAGRFGSGEKSLNNVQLFSKDGTLLQTVSFHKEDKFNWLSTHNIPEFGATFQLEGNSRSCLDSVTIKGINNANIPSYKFDYYSNAPSLPSIPTYSYGPDPWGLLTTQRDRPLPTVEDTLKKCWMLKSIIYPTGGIELFEYESDRYQPSLYSYRSSSCKAIFGGGLRLKSKTLIDTLTHTRSKYEYRYAQTNPLNPGYGFLNCEPSAYVTNASQGPSNAVLDNDVVQDFDTEVHYPDIQIINPDASIVRKYYSCSFSNSQTTDCGAYPYNSTYSCYSKSYSSITTMPDPYVDDPSTILYNGLYGNFVFYDLDGQSVIESDVPKNGDTKVFRTEIKEFDDEILLVRPSTSENTNSVTFRLFNNNWKRGLLTMEEFYPGPNDPSGVGPGAPIEVKQYFYTLQPIKTESYGVVIADGMYYPTPYRYFSLATSGWPKLTSIQTYKNNRTLFNKTEYTYNSENGLVEKEIISNSTGISKITYNTYAFKSNSDMTNRHMYSQKELTVVGHSGSDNSTFSSIQAGNLNINSMTRQTYSNILSGVYSQWYPDNTYQWIDKNNNGNFDAGEEICILDNIKYDICGNILESRDANDVSYVTKWAYNSLLPVAGFNNASSNEISFTDFEDGTTGDWEVASGAGSIELMAAHTGRKGYYMDYSYGSLRKAFWGGELSFGKKYTFSAWVYGSSESRLRCKVEFESGECDYLSINATATGGWENLEIVVDLPVLKANWGMEVISLELYVENGDPDLGNFYACSWDDIRFYPNGSLMLSNTYDPATYKMTSHSDENSTPSYFEYDGLQRLLRTRNYAGNLLSSNSYYYSRFANTAGTFDPLKPNCITESKYFNSSSAITQKQYFDSFGRNIQSQVVVGGEDIVSHTDFDNMGRIFRKYKPYQIAISHSYDSKYFTHDTAYYNNNVYNGAVGKFRDQYPFTETKYLYNGLPFIIKPAGKNWYENHFIENRYYLSGLAGYTTGQFERKEIYNENDYHNDSNPRDVRFEYYDAMGNLIQTVVDPYGLNLTTKFQYDVFGKLTKTIPPNGEPFSTNYRYNTLGQLIQKTSPDAGTVHYIYDSNGNLRFVRDANHHNSEGLNDFSEDGYIYDDGVPETRYFTLYNKGKVNFQLNSGGNEIYEGSIRLQLKGPNDVVLLTITANSSNPSPSLTMVLPIGYYSCTIISSAVTDYATDFSINCNSNIDFIYHKYDRLNRVVETGEYETTSLGDFSQGNADNPLFPENGCIVSKRHVYDLPSTEAIASGQRNLKGKVSYTMSFDPGYYNNVSEANATFYSYDEMGRVEWSIQRDLGWYNKKLVFSYDLLGNIIKKGYYDYDWRSGSFYTDYIYDQAGRLTTVRSANNSSMTGAVQEASFQYFASGKTKRCQLGLAQGVDYRYNERDWLTMINHQNLNQYDDPGHDGGNGIPVDKFGMIIDYNRVNNHIAGAQGAQPQWNGNISWVMYRIGDVAYSGPEGTSPLVGYTYSYDKSNRLTKADFGYYTNAWKGTYAFDETGYTYDGNGNIRSLTRYGKNAGLSGSTVMDNLTYNYNSGKNQLNYVSENISDASYTGDVDNQPGNNYLYDANGNLVQDIKNGIGFIIYDMNNLPLSVYKTGGSQLFFSYDVNGNRVRKLAAGENDVYYTNNPAGQTEVVTPAAYGSEFTYNIWGNDNIGQVKVNGSAATRYYYLKDHLGSIRMTVDEQGAVVGYNDYYPFGGIMEGRSGQSGSDGRYKFTSKERDSETGLDYFGKRYYDSRIGRWMSVDPLADKHPRWTPYNYCANNPIKLIDPNGLDWILSTGNRVYWYRGNTGDKTNLIVSFKATSGQNNARLKNGTSMNLQFAKYQGVKNGGPTPEGKYSINLVADPKRTAQADTKTGDLKPNSSGGIEKIPSFVPNENKPGYGWSYSDWGQNRAKLDPQAGNDMSGRENSFYFHDSEKGYTHGCTEVESGLFDKLNEYRNDGNESIEVIIDYPNPNHNTNGGTKKDE